MQDTEHALTEATTALNTLTERLRNQTKYRDKTILDALNTGTTWDRIQQITGLSRRGIQLAIGRAKTSG